jgi:hypothetical protein
VGLGRVVSPWFNVPVIDNELIAIVCKPVIVIVCPDAIKTSSRVTGTPGFQADASFQLPELVEIMLPARANGHASASNRHAQ